MGGRVRIVGISGSLRRGSYNEQLLRAAGEALPPGAELVTWDRLGELPPYDPDFDEAGDLPDAVHDLREALSTADGLFVATPEYNGTIPGGLKTAIDWGSRPRDIAALKDLPAAVAGATTGLFGAVWAQADTRKALGIAGAEVVDGEVPVGQADRAFDGDRLAEPELQAALERLLADLVDAARARAEHRVVA